MKQHQKSQPSPPNEFLLTGQEIKKISKGFISLQKYGSKAKIMNQVDAQIAGQTDQFSFSYVSSHNIQEPLRKIQTFSSRILEKEQKNLSDSGKEYFVRMHKAAKQMHSVIEDLRIFSQLETAEKNFEHSDLNALINEVTDSLQKKCDQVGALIKVYVDVSAAVIPSQFRLLVQNLLLNSLKFRNKNQSPVISIRGEICSGEKTKGLNPSKKYCRLSFRDNGIGFESQYCERIFQMFERLNGKDEYDGNGMGLTLCKKIAEIHGGTIIADARPAEGASFEIYFLLTH